jgi:hypothetical protein
MSKKLFIRVVPLLAIAAFMLVPAGAQAAPHYYKNNPASVQYAAGKPVHVIAWGRLTLKPEPPVAAVTSCENASGGFVENPEGGGAGIGATERFATWDCSNEECPKGEVEIAPGVKVEKEFEVISMPQSFPWPSELLETTPIRSNNTEVEVELACVAHRIGPFSNSTANKNEFEPTRLAIGEGGSKGAGINEQAVFTKTGLEGNPTVNCKTQTAAETGGPKEQKPEGINGTNFGPGNAKTNFSVGSGALSCAGGAFEGTTKESLKVMNYATSELINTKNP